MNKKEKINEIMKKLLEDENLKKILIGVSNDQCLSEDINDLEERNNLFAFLGMSLSLLFYSEILKLNTESNFVDFEEEKVNKITKDIKYNKELNGLIKEIVDNEIDINESKIKYHLFLTIVLGMLINRNIICLNKEAKNKDLY